MTMDSQDTKPKEWVCIEGLYDAARRAFSGISFDPEKRAERAVRDYEQELNEDLASLPAHEQEGYAQGYKKHLFAWLSAKGRCVSPMIAGPANFPVRRMEKLNLQEHNRMEEFIDWRKRKLAAIAKRAKEAEEAAKTPQQRLDERFDQIRKGLMSSIATIIGIDRGEVRGCSRQLIVANMVGTIRTLARNGEAELVGRCLELISEVNGRKDVLKPIVSQRHSVWKLLEEATASREKMEVKAGRESEEEEMSGVRVVRNYGMDRLQLFFEGKPDGETIARLKKSAFRWSPSQGCWQRQLTPNAIRALKIVVG